MKHDSPDLSGRVNTQDSQFRAEFSDFNVEGLKKFQASKKQPGLINTHAFMQRDFDFTPETHQEKQFDDFLNWDINTPTQIIPPASTVLRPELTNDFTAFEFIQTQHSLPSSGNRQPFEDDFFGVKTEHLRDAATGTGQTSSGDHFWNEFSSEKSSQMPQASVVKQLPSNTNLDSLLHLSLGPKDEEKEQVLPPASVQTKDPFPSTPHNNKGALGFLDIGLN